MELRPPVHIPLLNGGQPLGDTDPYVVTQILHMWKLLRSRSTNVISSQMGRSPDEVRPVSPTLLFLLKEGFTLRSYCPFDPEEFIRRGREYLKEFYEADWNSQWDDYFTEKLVTARQEQRRQEQAKFAKYGKLFREEIKLPTFNDIYSLMAESKRPQLIHVALRTNGGPGTSSALVYGMPNLITVKIYVPGRPHRETFLTLPRQTFLKRWLPDEGMVAVSR